MPEFAWDNSILKSVNPSSNTPEIRVLMAKACRSTLTPSEQKELENALAKDSSLILHLDLTPAKVSALFSSFISNC